MAKSTKYIALPKRPIYQNLILEAALRAKRNSNIKIEKGQKKPASRQAILSYITNQLYSDSKNIKPLFRRELDKAVTDELVARVDKQNFVLTEKGRNTLDELKKTDVNFERWVEFCKIKYAMATEEDLKLDDIEIPDCLAVTSGATRAISLADVKSLEEMKEMEAVSGSSAEFVDAEAKERIEKKAKAAKNRASNAKAKENREEDDEDEKKSSNKKDSSKKSSGKKGEDKKSDSKKTNDKKSNKKADDKKTSAADKKKNTGNKKDANSKGDKKAPAKSNSRCKKSN